MSAKLSSVSRQGVSVCLCAMALLMTGCNTLASLGLPVGTSHNKLLASAQSISDAPGRSISLPTELAQQPLPHYLVAVGDTVLIEPVSFESTIRLAGDQIVKPNGMVSLGEFGEFLADGKTVEQIKLEVQSLIDQEIRQRLLQERANELAAMERRQALRLASGDFDDDELDEDDLEANRVAEQEAEFAFEQTVQRVIEQNRISVRLVSWASKRFYVLGEVNSPGFYNYTGTEDVLFAITEAGGLTSKADSHQIIVARPTPCGSCKIVLKTCYNHIVQLGDTSTNYQILPGDRVFVPALTFCEDVRRSFGGSKNDCCPRCADCPVGCCLPEGCPVPQAAVPTTIAVDSYAETLPADDTSAGAVSMSDAVAEPAVVRTASRAAEPSSAMRSAPVASDYFRPAQPLMAR